MPRNAEKNVLFLSLIMILIMVVAIFSAFVRGDTGNDETSDNGWAPWVPFRASIKSINVTVDINHSFTTTVIEQVFFNPFRRPLGDTFMFKVPQDAFITNFSVEVDGKIHYAGLMEKAEAEKSYQDAVSKGNSAGILLSRETTKFPYSLNFGPSQVIKCCLVYEEFTSLYLGRYKYDLFLHGINGHRVVPNLNLDIRVNALAPLTAINATGNYQDPRIIWETPEKCNIMFRQNDTDKISNLFFRFETETLPLGGRLMSYRRENETYFLHLFSPTQDSLGALPINKNIIFVLDKSGSMSGTKMEQLKSAFSDIIQSLDQCDTFNVIMFDSYIELYSEEPVPASNENRTGAMEYVNKAIASGCTNLYDGTAQALAQLSKALWEGNQNMPMVIMLTDGLANRGAFVSSLAIQDNIKKLNDFDATLYCLGFGDDVDFDLLNNLAFDNNGMAKKIYTDSDAVEQLVEFYRMVSTPLMRNLSFSYSGDCFEVYPETVDCLFDGSEVIVAGKADGIVESLNSTVTGHYSDGRIRISTTFDIESRNESNIVPRFWAYKKTLHLLDRISKEGEREELMHEIVSLSLEFGFLTRYTGFFVDVGSFSEGTGAWEENADGWSEDTWDNDGISGGGSGDSDGNGVPDNQEPGNPDADSDGDGLSNGQEGSDPYDPDTDHDGIPDGIDPDPLVYDDDFENWGNYDSDDNGIPDNQEPDNPNADSDGDGLTNWQENENGTDPRYPDTDGDGFWDWTEVFHGSDPCDPESNPDNADADADGLSNIFERELGTDPFDADTDSDGLEDGQELDTGTNPFHPDTDNDGLFDGREVEMGCNPLYGDSDNDTFSDGYEVRNGKDPMDPQSFPAPPDTDCDGLSNIIEREIGTDPFDPDSDDDGFLDGDEARLNHDPLDDSSHPPYSDMDCNGILDRNEPENPNADSDGDGVLNAQETQYGTDPLNPNSFPNILDGGDTMESADENRHVMNGLFLDGDSDGFCDSFDTYPEDAERWNKLYEISDRDADGVADMDDSFPDDPLEWVDGDSDGTGDNGDLFPLDPNEWCDTDLDGIGDNQDAFPLNSTEWNDTDNDGRGDNTDVFPSDPDRWSDTDEIAIGGKDGNTADERETPINKLIIANDPSGEKNGTDRLVAGEHREQVLQTEEDEFESGDYKNGKLTPQSTSYGDPWFILFIVLWIIIAAGVVLIILLSMNSKREEDDPDEYRDEIGRVKREIPVRNRYLPRNNHIVR